MNMQLPGLASAGLLVTRCGLATCFLWVGALKFKDYEVENAEVLVTASPLTSRLREELGAQKLARLIGVTQITLGSLIAAKPFAPRASAVGSLGAAGMMLGTLSFLATTPEAWQEGQGMPQLSMLGEALLKDGVLLGACLLTAADSLRAGPAPVIGRRAVAPRPGIGGAARQQP
jgi:reactive chlorine resistance protein C